MKRIVIIGAGESGTGAAILAKKQGFEVFVSDFGNINPAYKNMLNQHYIKWEEGVHTEELILNADEIIKSPGVSELVPIMQKVIAAGIPIIDEIEFAGRYTSSKMICITGSNGKTTTANLIYHTLKNAGLDVGLAGNIGNSLALQVALNPHEYYVVELSSFQLDRMYEFKADVAIMLNITPDHLDRYDYQFQNYIDSKFRLIQNQTKEDYFIFWEDDPVIQEELAKRNIPSKIYPYAFKQTENTKAFVEEEKIIINVLNELFMIPTKDLSLRGIHNTYNSMASSLAASALDVKKDIIRQSLLDFQGVEHRLEYVATVRNIRFINDSKATNVNSCWYALLSMDTPVVLIMGGSDKGNDYSEIEKLVNDKVRALIFLGEDNTALHQFFDGMKQHIFDAKSMEEAVQKAYEIAENGDTVLLSPACASFDLFENYEDRGRQFKQHVRNL